MIVVLSAPALEEFFDLVWLKIKVALGSLMGYSGRYHAASLAAVFLALAIGILIGVGFGSDVVSGTAEDLESSLGSDLDRRNERIGELEDELDREAEFGQLAYPGLGRRPAARARDRAGRLRRPRRGGRGRRALGAAALRRER